jgi:hypothetical protein
MLFIEMGIMPIFVINLITEDGSIIDINSASSSFSNLFDRLDNLLCEELTDNSSNIQTAPNKIGLQFFAESSKFTNPAVIEAGIKNGTITKAQVKDVLINLVGDDLGSWVLSDEAGYSLYMNLLTACKNAGISLSDMKTSIGVMEVMAKYYEDARSLKVDVEPEYFDTYRTHGIVHIFDVLTQSINSYTAFKNAGINNISLDTIMLAAVMHDTGMSGGQQIHLTTVDGKLVITTKTTDSSSKAYRESHSFNSAVNILNEFEVLRKAGYTDLQIAEAALLTFAHSKSNSGLNPLSGNVEGWSFATQALAKATEGSGFNIIDVLIENGKLLSSDIKGYSKDKKIKTPTVEVVGEIGLFEFDGDWLNSMAYEGLIIRLGDALTNNDNAGTNQYGKTIDLSKVDYNLQKDIASVFKTLGVDSSLSLQEQFKLLMTDDELGLAKAAAKEAGDLSYKIDGNDYKTSQQFVLGENNQIYNIRTLSDGTIEVVVSLKSSEAVPFCTIFAIDERLQELNSKGAGIFGDDGKSIKMVVEIDSSSSTNVKNLYQQYAEFSSNADVKVEIREVSNLANGYLMNSNF